MLTRYHVVVRDFGAPSKVLMRSTLSGVTLLVDDHFYDLLVKGHDAGGCPADIAALLHEHFLVPDEKWDRNRVLAYIERVIGQQKVMSVTIMTTGACNMACRYCFQNELLTNHLHFRSEMTEPLVMWIVETAKRLRVNTVMVHFYGGEPLLNMPFIEKVVNAVRPRLSRHRICWEMSITTNGTLLSKSVVDRLYQMGCNLAIVSLDGTPDVHDYRRPLKNPQYSSFERVTEGIRNAVRRFDVMSRTNIDHHNANNLSDLIALLKDMGLLDHSRFFHSLEAVGPVLHSTQHVRKSIMTKAECGQIIAEGFRLQAQAGVRLYGNMPSEVACEHINSASFTVDHHGDIFPCPGFVGIQGFSIGNVLDGVDDEKMRRLYSVRPWEREPCISCKYLPQCRGGCRSCGYIVQQQSDPGNAYGSIYCRKDFFQSAFAAYLEALYLHKGKLVPARRLPGTSY